MEAIDILARDENAGNHVVIELKKSQTSDDTIGQLTRYMGWVMDKKGDENVRGIIISANYDMPRAHQHDEGSISIAIRLGARVNGH